MRPTPLAWFILSLFAAIVALIIYGPILLTVLSAFFEGRAGMIDLRRPSLASFRAIESDLSILRALGITVIVGVVSSLFSIVFGTLSALYFSSGKGIDRNLLQLLIFVPFVMPPMITGLSLLIFFRNVDLDRSLVTVIIGHAILLLAVAYRTVVARLAQLSGSLTEASLDLGASHLQTFWYVILPNLRSALIVSFVLCFALSFDETLVTILLTGSESTFPIRLWAMMRLGFSPSVNALVVLILTISILVSIAAIKLLPGRSITTGLGGE